VSTTGKPPIMTGKERFYAWLLFGILIAAFWLRYLGIPFGFPLITHPDEPAITAIAFRMVEKGTLDPRSFLYPSATIYLHAALSAVVFAVGSIFGRYHAFADVPVTTLYWAGRFLTVLLSVLTIHFTAATARVLFDRVVGVLAALFLACSYLHVENSYLITVDSPMAFWATLSFFFAALHYRYGPRWRYVVLNALCIGVAIGTKYTAVWLVLPMLYAHLGHASRSPRRLLDRKLLVGLALVPVAFVFSTPYLVVEFDLFRYYIWFQRGAYSKGHPGWESDATSYVYYLGALNERYGLLSLFASAVGILGLSRSDAKRAGFVASFPLGYLLFLGAYRVHFDRNLVIVLPFLAVMGGYGVVWALRRLGGEPALSRAPRRVLSIVVLTLAATAVLLQAGKSVAHVRAIRLPDTRYVAKLWIEAHLPAGATIAREQFAPPLDRARFAVKNLGYYGLIRSRDESRTADFVVASSGDYGRFFGEPERYPSQIREYEEIFRTHTLVKEFVGDGKTMSGPTIRVYRRNAPEDKKP
jgi:4-amino-4-deoxy-L-arabinose transferase-like glycosyltransferase